MQFYKFLILNDEPDQSLGVESIPILFNSEHIVSIKPIRILHRKKIIDGHWIRTSNNKKYRATEIPDELKARFDGENTNSKIIDHIDEMNNLFLEENDPADSVQ
ncbi:MAG: hypothetical protein ACPGJV_12905 [Bacteriovoracaceae bacterium]